eukprot:15233449-Heterocapsa_arctica.AAC.1
MTTRPASRIDQCTDDTLAALQKATKTKNMQKRPFRGCQPYVPNHYGGPEQGRQMNGPGCPTRSWYLHDCAADRGGCTMEHRRLYTIVI